MSHCKDAFFGCQTSSNYLLLHLRFLIGGMAKSSYYVNHSGTAYVHPQGSTLRRLGV